MFNTLSFEGNNQREINKFEENVQNSISKTTNAVGNTRRARFEQSPLIHSKKIKERINDCSSLETKFTIKRWENDRKKTNKDMEIRKNERKEELQGFKHRVY